MGWLRSAYSSVKWRIWVRTVLPTCLMFLGAAVALRYLVRGRIAHLVASHGQTPAEAFDATFTGLYIFVAFVLITLASSVMTHLFLDIAFKPWAEVIRITRELGQGNYRVRADIGVANTSREFRLLALSVNQLAESLERTERLRRELMANMAHEIRTPLTNLQGYIEALRDGVIEANEEALTSVHEEVMRLVRLVDALHQLSRADALRQAPLQCTLEDLDTMVERLARVARPEMEARGITFYLDTGARRVLTPVHADSIAQVIRNLLRNAAQYTEDGGVIRLQTACVGSVYRFTCINTGMGIAPEDLPLIFKRFYRTEKARQRSRQGVGIGLAICKEIVEAHGGRIGVESKAGWTTVWFELPTGMGVKLEPEQPRPA